MKYYLFPKYFTKENKVFRVVGLILFTLTFCGLLWVSLQNWYSIFIGCALVALLDLIGGIGRKSPLFEGLNNDSY